MGGQLAPPSAPSNSHIPNGGAPNTPHTQAFIDSHEKDGVGGQATETTQPSRDSHPEPGGFGSDQPAAQICVDSHRASGGGPLLVDPTLEMAADIVDDLERVRTANENRLRQLTDTSELGHGLTLDNADVKRLAALVESLKAAEHQAVLNLGRLMRRHPLGEFIKQRSGLGEKQTARLLAAIRDPHWNDLHARPRTLRELYAFCGMHAPGGVAPARRRGERINWSPDARMRIWLIADKCIQIRTSPYRKIYDDGRLKYADAVHDGPCAQCGPKSHPAQPGSPLSAGHQHARARRLIAKAILRDLWQAAKELHAAQAKDDSHVDKRLTPDTQAVLDSQSANGVGGGVMMNTEDIHAAHASSDSQCRPGGGDSSRPSPPPSGKSTAKGRTVVGMAS